jgi:Flp pilus assembly protein CpaB
VLGAQLAVGARANETLLWSDLTSVRPELRKLSSLVPHGSRAMTLQARGSSFDALLTPGDRVDVLRQGAGGSTEVVLQDVVVLAVGDDLGGPETRAVHARGSARGASVTVSVTLEQSRVLAQAEALGTLRLVMRNPDDIGLGASSAAPRAGGAP